MSDEFLKIATDEINNEISEIKKLLNSCYRNSDVYAKATKIQKSTHKIKGLAPMMGKEELGNLSDLLDSILMKIIDGATSDEILELLIVAVSEMKNSMTQSEYDLNKIKQRILQISSTIS